MVYTIASMRNTNNNQTKENTMMIQTQQQVTKTATCTDCGKTHQVDHKTFDTFGVDCMCMKCVDWNHVNFMHRNKAGIKTCTKGCRCGFGGK